mmetsp:Transcript_43393/g.136000  ORF Transcript_43393/g.136000 Transcript_43393/m.136000 type:complete len:253 (+) Transcript_43393:123-881(+)
MRSPGSTFSATENARSSTWPGSFLPGAPPLRVPDPMSRPPPPGAATDPAPLPRPSSIHSVRSQGMPASKVRRLPVPLRTEDNELRSIDEMESRPPPIEPSVERSMDDKCPSDVRSDAIDEIELRSVRLSRCDSDDGRSMRLLSRCMRLESRCMRPASRCIDGCRPWPSMPGGGCALSWMLGRYESKTEAPSPPCFAPGGATGSDWKRRWTPPPSFMPMSADGCRSRSVGTDDRLWCRCLCGPYSLRTSTSRT